MNSIVNVLRLNVLRSWKSSLGGLGILLVALFGSAVSAEDQSTITDAVQTGLEILGFVMLLWREKRHRLGALPPQEPPADQ
jgi:hypothetical protein